jgi:lactonase family protein with 7-bladed beta-propeller/centrosomal CEP192-like protein
MPVSPKAILRALFGGALSIVLLTSAAVRTQAKVAIQFLFVVSGGQTPVVTTYSVDQATGALTTPPGVNPAPMRANPASSETGAVVNSAGTFLFVASQDSNNTSSVSVFSIASTGALTELAASPFSAADATTPRALAISPDGQYLYASSASSATPGSPLVDVYSIGADGTLTPLTNYVLPGTTTILFMHPTGQWLYAYGNASPGVPTIQEFTVGPSGTLTNAGAVALQDLSSAEALVGDSTGRYLFSLRNQLPGGVNIIDSFSVSGEGGALTLLSSYTNPPPYGPAEVIPAYEAIDSTGGFLFTTPMDFSITSGVPSLLQVNNTYFPYGVPFLLASRTSPFLFGNGESNAGYFLTSDMIGSDGTLTPAPGSPYSLPIGILAVTGSVPAPTEPILTLSTNSIAFPATLTRQTATSSVTLSSTGFSPLLINTISISGDASFTQTNNCPMSSMAAGATCTVTVKFAPTVAGTFTGALNIDSNAPAAAVSLSGTAPAVPYPDLVPSTLTFPSTTVGVASATQTFAVENLPVASATFQVTGITIGGSNPNDFSQTNNCTSSIAIGSSCTITVTFTPLAVGGRSATLTVTTNYPAQGNLGGILTGTGAAASGPSLSVPQSQQSGAAGSTFTFPINETGFATQPTLTATCSIPNGTCTISGTNLVVTTQMRSSGFAPGLFPGGPTMLTLALAILLLAGSSRARRVFRRAALVGGLALLAACQAGGGSAGAPNPPSGTPAGTYTITIHAVSGSQTATTTVSIVVQ